MAFRFLQTNWFQQNFAIFSCKNGSKALRCLQNNTRKVELKKINALALYSQHFVFFVSYD